VHGWSGRFLICFREVRGHSVENIKVRVHDQRCRGSYVRRIPTDFVMAGQDAFAQVNFSYALLGIMQIQSSKIADFNISYASVHDTYCGRCRYQSTSTPSLSGWMTSTLLRRRSRPIVPGFPSPYIDIGYLLFLEETLWRRKGRNGRSTERLSLRHSQRYVLSVVRRLILNIFARKIID
jgi:hypothetical protein